MRPSVLGLVGTVCTFAVACSRAVHPDPGPAPVASEVARTSGALSGDSAGNASNTGNAGSATDVPVLVELFSSEGCSSCPPAERALGDLLDHPPPGARVIALEQHVDYWDYLGHVDPFGSASFTERQRVHGKQLGSRTMYTPEAIVDGRTEMVGSRSADLARAIQAAATLPHVSVSLARSTPGHLHITVGALPAAAATAAATATATAAATLMIARTDRRPETRVDRGENAGSTLRHTWVARSISAVGEVGKDGASFETSMPVSAVGAGGESAHHELVAFVVDPANGAVLGSDAIPME